MDTMTAIVPQAQNGVKAPKATLTGIDMPAFFMIAFFKVSGSIYTFMAEAVSIPIVRDGAL
jgi:hypothetical protein